MDPHCFNADPDPDLEPAFYLKADPDSGSQTGERDVFSPRGSTALTV
jgi:hypothetical protein